MHKLCQIAQMLIEDRSKKEKQNYKKNDWTISVLFCFISHIYCTFKYIHTANLQLPQ